jgi:hypothetical protein
MQPNVQSILQEIIGEEHAERSECVVCHEGISALIDAELDAEEMKRPFVSLQQHLGSCPACQQEYEELQPLLRAGRRGELQEPPSPPIFDFSYLEQHPSKESTHQSNRTDTPYLGSLFSRLHRKADRLLAMVIPKSSSATSLPLPGHTAFSRIAGKTNRRALPIQADELRVGLLVGFPSRRNLGLGVYIRWAETDRPAERVQVEIRDTSRRVIARLLTSDDGCVTLPRVAAGEYMIEVRHRGDVFQLPFARQ